MATRMGLEPTTSAVTGRRSNQLSYQAIVLFLPGLLSETNSIIAKQKPFVKTFSRKNRKGFAAPELPRQRGFVRRVFAPFCFPFVNISSSLLTIMDYCDSLYYGNSMQEARYDVGFI